MIYISYVLYMYIGSTGIVYIVHIFVARILHDYNINLYILSSLCYNMMDK